ncbi:glycosyltransferase [Paludibaculum fermentans]|uniref:glycosyltransferase n=1 Tax=Paludibaculum fermentans TaxID=1473598 RepID=UPI003EB6F3DC
MREILSMPPELNAGAEASWDLYVLCAALVVVLLITAYGLYSRYQYGQLPELRLQSDSAVAAQGSLDHCVIIPARNDEQVIGRAVRSFPESLRVVVDDHSTDATAAHAEEAGATVRVARPMERGWLSKSNACWTGALYTDSAWILFADPDTWYEPRFLPSLLAYAAGKSLHAATVLPRQILVTWYEKMLVPYAMGLTFTGVSARNLNNPKHPEAMANGQCLLFRRSAYNFIGGHKAVASHPLEDLALARLIKRHRMSMAVLRCESMAQTRMFHSFGGAWRGLEWMVLHSARGYGKAPLLFLAAILVSTFWLPLLVTLIDWKYDLPAAILFVTPILAWRAWYGSLLRALWAPLALCLFPLIAFTALVRGALGSMTDSQGRRV